VLKYTKYQKDEDTPWVTFIHGAGGSSSIWYKQLRSFKENYNVLLIDLRGHGRSEGIPLKRWERYSFEAIGNDVLEVLDHLRIEKSHFVGISLGTIIIREISERYPERCLSMIMGGAIMKINFRGQLLMKLGVILKSVVPYLVLYRLFAFVIMPRKNHRDSRIFFIEEAKKLYQKEFVKWFAMAVEVNPLLSLFRFKDPGIPTLYIMGEQDHMFLPSVRKIVSDHSSAQLKVIPDCGHVVNIERANVFNGASIAFLGSGSTSSAKRLP